MQPEDGCPELFPEDSTPSFLGAGRAPRTRSVLCHCMVTPGCRLLFLIGAAGALRILDLAVPPSVESGSGRPVVLDCIYEVREREKAGLVLQWYLNDQHTPVYQWIPRKEPQDLGALRGRLDLTHRVSGDPHQAHRAMRILHPSPELSGNYTCRVSTFYGEDASTRKMIVYSPPRSLELSYSTPREGAINVSCAAAGAFPEPRITLRRRDARHPGRQDVLEGEVRSVRRDGRYDVSVYSTLQEGSPHAETIFECLLTIPQTDYVVSRAANYRPAPDLSRGSSASSSTAEAALLVVCLSFLLGLSFGKSQDLR